MRLPKIALAAASLAFAFSSTAAQAASCQPGTAGCVLPLPGPAPTASVPTSTAVPVGEALIEEGGFNALPFILGAIALAALAAFLLLQDDEDPITP